MIYLIAILAIVTIFILVRSASYLEFKKNLTKLLFIAGGFLCFLLLVRITPVIIAGISGIFVALLPAILRLVLNSASIISIIRGLLPKIFLKKQKNVIMSHEVAREILGVKPNASKAQITKAYREKMKLHHPDHGGSTEMSHKINEAKTTLLTELENESK